MNLLLISISESTNSPVAGVMSNGIINPKEFKSDLNSPEHRNTAATNERAFGKFKLKRLVMLITFYWAINLSWSFTALKMKNINIA